ncbi:TetR/AcrR family transcriptional regulator [Nocardia cyriacigeorgica]|nr:TetR/AcrR family transcriptional regulator [Nocardia cyriacigeorgica]MBF6480261.1 TetR/AcrR family transcriptional regulator [Nocardia cyriacigeorgica]MBF6552464.1 TetR/AcrR family transcriptional regulator [Nocardia cyriacigeorgica]
MLAAARTFLSEGRSAVSIQEITDAADVGFGSFYNHFDSKEQLFDEAVRSALQAYSELRDGIVARYDDPAEVFAVSFRMTGRLQRRIPEMVRVVLNSGMGVMMRDEGLAPRARRDIAAAQEAGRFEPMDPDLAVMAAGGAMLGLLQLLDADPSADADALSDEMTYRLLRMFGMNKRTAQRLSSGPLPEIPEL